MNNPIISVSGVRGIVGESLTPDIVLKFGISYGTYIKGDKKIVFGKDTRITGDMVVNALISGLLSVGCEVTYLGIAPTPTVQFLTRKLNFDGGIVVSASHNPIEWNAFKFYKKGGMLFDNSDNKKLLEIFNQKKYDFIDWRKYKKLNYDTKLPELHIKEVLSFIQNISAIKSKKFKVALDSCNAAGSFLTPMLLKELNCDLKTIYTSPNGYFPHNPEPIKNNLKDIIKFMKKNKCDVGFVQDSDADRLAVLDEYGNFISEEYTLALAVYYILSEYDNINFLKKNYTKTVVTNLSTSKMIDDIASKFKVKVYRTPVGELNVAKEMITRKSVIGGEGNGGVIFPPVNYGRDSFSGIAIILQLLAKSNLKLSKILNQLPKYYMIKTKFNIKNIDVKKLFEKIKKELPTKRINKDDGLKFEFDDSFVHIRVSNTEPIIRVVAEAPKKEKVKKLVEVIEKCVG